MSDKKLVSPDQIDVKEEYLIAFDRAFSEMASSHGKREKNGIAALLAYITNHPPLPSHEQKEKMMVELLNKKVDVRVARDHYPESWARQMFLKPVPEIPEALKKLVLPHAGVQVQMLAGDVNALLKEAFRAGQLNPEAK